MRSVQFHIVPCPSLYFFSRSICPFQCLINANYMVLICCTCDVQSSFLFFSFLFFFFGFLCLQVSSESNFRPDTEGEGGHLFRLTCSIVLQGGMNTANKCHWYVWGVLTVSGPHWICPAHGVCAFSFYIAQTPGCYAGELSNLGPGLRVVPRSMPLRFRVSGTPQRNRLSWACEKYFILKLSTMSVLES